MILIAQLHNEDRLNGTLNNLLRGAGAARMRVYDDSGTPERPASIADAPTGVLMAEFVLPAEIGTVSSNKLTLALPPNALVLADGTARYARFVDGDDATSMDVDVSELGGGGELQFEAVTVLAGGLLRLLSAEIG